MLRESDSCLQLRSELSAIMCETFAAAAMQSESQIAHTIKTAVAALPKVLPQGWYSPPPAGIGVLFGKSEGHYQRTRFDSLRNSEYWPNSTCFFESETVAIVYASPVWSQSGIIGDWGATIYQGEDTEIQHHLVKCLQVVEQLAEYAEVGMEFGDISRYADKLLRDNKLTSDHVLLTNRTNVTGTNCGHTIPWTDQLPSMTEAQILKSGDQDSINKLISAKRVFINASETMQIPETIIFTSELRLESLDNPELPTGYFHILVSFLNGQKTIVSNFNPFFKVMGMNFIQSKY